MTNRDRVVSFMNNAGQPVRNAVQKVSPAEAQLRVRLLLEEVLELAEASGVRVRAEFDGANSFVLDNRYLHFSGGDPEQQDLVEIADALADIQYVNEGAAITWGIPLQICFDQVCDSNDSKFIDGYRNEETGKWMKGKSYFPVDLKWVTSYADNQND